MYFFKCATALGRRYRVLILLPFPMTVIIGFFASKCNSSAFKDRISSILAAVLYMIIISDKSLRSIFVDKSGTDNNTCIAFLLIPLTFYVLPFSLVFLVRPQKIKHENFLASQIFQESPSGSKSVITSFWAAATLFHEPSQPFLYYCSTGASTTQAFPAYSLL